ncbi:MAG: hypothetical protein ACREEQ_00255 [Caulobacteraceae bacterium]
MWGYLLRFARADIFVCFVFFVLKYFPVRQPQSLSWAPAFAGVTGL